MKVNYNEWINQREQWQQKYPSPPPEQHLRLDIELSYPRKLLSQVPIDFNPHSYCNYDGYECFYVCDDWSTIFEVCESPHEQPTLRMLVESGHNNSWGEKIRLLSTSCSIFHEHWARYKNWNDFAFFRGMYWKITYNQALSDWPGGRVWGLPFQDRRHFNDDIPHGNLWSWFKDEN